MNLTIPRQWLHGFLDLCLLSLLAEGRNYGRGLKERLAGAGFGEMPGGSLYPALLRLEQQGLVRTQREVSASGPPRKYYELTHVGRGSMRDQQLAWQQFSTAINAMVVSSIHTPSAEEAM